MRHRPHTTRESADTLHFCYCCASYYILYFLPLWRRVQSKLISMLLIFSNRSSLADGISKARENFTSCTPQIFEAFYDVNHDRDYPSRADLPPAPPSPKPFYFLSFDLNEGDFSSNLAAVEELRLSFEVVNPCTFQNPTTWTSCFEKISYQVHSAANDTASDFILCEHDFPLTVGEKRVQLWRPNFPPRNRTSNNGWTVARLSDEEDDQDDDWEIVDEGMRDLHIDSDVGTDLEAGSGSSSADGSETTSLLTREQGLSYKEMLLKKAAEPAATPSKPADDLLQLQRREKAKASPWTPTLVVTKVPRLRADKTYGQNKSVVNDDDEDGCWDLYEAHAAVKYSTGISRYRATTMLTPKAMEKKNTRILEKIVGSGDKG